MFPVIFGATILSFLHLFAHRRHQRCGSSAYWDILVVVVVIVVVPWENSRIIFSTRGFQPQPHFVRYQHHDPPVRRWQCGVTATTRFASSSVPSSNIIDDINTNIRCESDANDNSRKTEKLLQNVVCLVTGASRGIGKGIALQLGAQGAIVYVTGTTTNTNATSPAISTLGSTSTRDAVVSPESEEAETIERTAQEIQQLGGIGIPIRCDHANDTDVQNVIQQIEQEYGYLDILVNNAFRFPTISIPSVDSPGTDDSIGTTTSENATSTMEFLLRRRFWEQGALAWDSVHTVGLRSHYITTCMAMKLLFLASQRKRSSTSSAMISRPLIVMISSFGGLTYSFNVAYGVGKAGVDRMVKDMAHELMGTDICVVSLWPGVVATERTQRSVQNGEWDRYVQLSLDLCETPQFTGRAIVALSTDPDNLRKSGTVQVVAELATEYGFTDINDNGRNQIPPSIRSLRFLLYNYVIQANPLFKNRVPYHWIPDIRIPFWIMAQGQPPTSSTFHSD